ncbi:asparagine synthetase B family protein [Halalkalicoccus ordinarius]|uniref:asparagine synthase n=1 Tax=Halalkalicoccus ordinarius TaxID=3116651 RepID=UPI00300EEE5D
MVGVCGATGSIAARLDALVEPLRWGEHEHVETTNAERLAIASASRGSDEQPARTGDSDALWCFGEVYGFGDAAGYESRYETGLTSGAYAAERYAEHGLGFAAGMNATASQFVHRPDRDELVVITDRLGTHPVYYAAVDGGVVLSTSIQSLPRHPAVDAEVDREGFYEYLAFNRVSGLETPFEDVSTLPPGSITTIDLATGERETEQYWRLRYEPLDRSFSYFVDRFVELLQRVLEERSSDPRRYGLLLSGGSDSRLLLAAADVPVAYHLADWMSREARTAERAAMSSGAKLRLLRRPDDHHERMLEHVPSRMNFNGRFDQAHVNGFDGRLREEVDVLMTGLYGDSFFKGGLVPKRVLDLGGVGSITTPVARDLGSVEDYLDALDGSLPPYVERPPSIDSVLRERIEERDDGSIVFGGVEYPSLRELVLFSDYYPLSNDRDYHYFGLTQMVGHWAPFLDNRFIDLARSMPIRYHLQRDVIDAALSALSPELASLPNAGTGVPPETRFPLNYVHKYGSLFWRKHVDDEELPRPYYSRGPWRDRGVVIRERGFGEAFLEERDDALRALPYLDRERAWECYRAHMAGEDYTAELCTLFTVLAAPAFAAADR